VTVDGWVVPEAPDALIAKGAHNHVAMVLGTTRDEYSSVIDLMVPGDVPDDAAYLATLETWFEKSLAAKVHALYPLSVRGAPRAALAAVVSDQVMHCAARRTARAAAKGQTEPVYRYLFAHAPSAGPMAAYGAGHAVDVDYMFRTWQQVKPRAVDYALSDDYVRAVGHFAATGAATWPRYDAATDPYVVIDEPMSEARDLRLLALRRRRRRWLRAPRRITSRARSVRGRAAPAEAGDDRKNRARRRRSHVRAERRLR